MTQENPKTYDGPSDEELEKAGKVFIGCMAIVVAVVVTIMVTGIKILVKSIF